MFIEVISQTGRKIYILVTEISAVIQDNGYCTIEMKNGDFYHILNEYEEVKTEVNSLLWYLSEEKK